jgi:hypothetical protein
METTRPSPTINKEMLKIIYYNTLIVINKELGN